MHAWDRSEWSGKDGCSTVIILQEVGIKEQKEHAGK